MCYFTAVGIAHLHLLNPGSTTKEVNTRRQVEQGARYAFNQNFCTAHGSQLPSGSCDRCNCLRIVQHINRGSIHPEPKRLINLFWSDWPLFYYQFQDTCT